MSSIATKMLEEIHEKLKDIPPLLSRKFVSISNGNSSVKDAGETVRVMQWNILAQALSTGKDNFVRCPPKALAKGTRQYRILEELLTYDADILCLQEVDLFPFFKQKLEEVGYEGIFKAKPDSPCLYVEGSDSPDGCALFYKASKVKLVNSKAMQLRCESWDTNQVTIICTFELKAASSCEFVVAVTHLKAKKGYHDLRHNQGMDLLEKVRHVAGTEKPVVICGDFNGEPDEPVYSAYGLSKLGLTSAYKQLCNGSEPPYTTWKIRGVADRPGEIEYKRTIDYMWISKSKVHIKALLEFPSGEEIGPDRLPSYSYPSDHLSLAADLVIT